MDILEPHRDRPTNFKLFDLSNTIPKMVELLKFLNQKNGVLVPHHIQISK